VADYTMRFPEVPVEQIAAVFESHRDNSVHKSARKEQSPEESASRTPTIIGPESGEEEEDTAPDLQRVSYFGDYVLLREIARGGMGVVYEARQKSLNRPVALKMILSGHLATSEQVARFRREAEAAAQLDHPGIVPIYEIGTVGDQHYFAMAYVSGPSLSARLRARPLDPREAAALVRDVALAVQYAHERGVVHRDLKPSNILLAPRAEGQRDLRGTAPRVEATSRDSTRLASGNTTTKPATNISVEQRVVPIDESVSQYSPRVSDFGLAKFSNADHSLTESGQILGTPSYMPPEQAAGLTNEVGPAADIYSLGAVLYACLTGRPPFQSASAMDTVRQVLERDPVSLRDLNVAIPLDLETISLKCLEKSIPRRYATAREVADELHRYLDGHPILARPISRRERAWRWCRRNPVTAGLSAAVMLSLLLGTVVSSYFAWKENKRAIAETSARREESRQRLEADRQRVEADRQTSIARFLANENRDLADQEAAARKQADLNAATAQQQTQLAQRHLYAAHMNLAQAAWEASRVGEVARLLNLYRPAPGQIADDDLRGFEWYYWDRCCHSDLLTFQAPRFVQTMAYSRDGQWLASSSFNLNLVPVEPGEVKIWDAATGRELRTLKGHTNGVIHVEFSPDGQRLASASLDATAKIWDMTTGQCLLTFQEDFERVNCLAFSCDGRRIITGSSSLVPSTLGTELKIWDAKSGEKLQTLERSPRPLQRVIFSPDDQQLASVQIDNIGLWDLNTGKIVQSCRHIAAGETTNGLLWGVNDLAFSLDGRQLATASQDQTIKMWDTSTGQELKTLRGHTGGVGRVAFTPDGQRLVSSSNDQTIRIWDVSTGLERSCLKGHTDTVVAVAINSEGTRLASADSSGAIKLWDVETQQSARPLEPPDSASSVAFRSDGQILAIASGQKIHLCDPRTGRIVRTLEIRGPVSPITGKYKFVPINDVAFSPSGLRLAAAFDDGTCKLLDATTGADFLSLPPQAGGVSSVAFSGDGQRVATGTSPMMLGKTLGEVKVWDANSGVLLLDLKGHSHRVHSVAFSPDSHWLAAASSDRTICHWNTATGQLLRTLSGHLGAVNRVVFSPDGKQLASAGGAHDHTLKLWDATTGQERFTMRGHGRSVECLSFSHDGKRIASASIDGTVKVWDTATGLELLAFQGPVKMFRCVTFSPDSNRLVGGGIYGSTILWDGTAPNQNSTLEAQ
jgi:WD40 repeat protein/serine/threonine protein kinase